MNKNNNHITTPTQLKELSHTPNGVRECLGFPTDGTYYAQPNPHELFQSITEGMLEVFKRKNADYGNSFDKSLDEDGLLVAKVRLGDKYNRFSQLIKQSQQVDDESLEDTLLDMANYAIMTVMWMRGQDKQLEMDLGQTFSKTIEVGSMVMINNPDGSADGPYKVDKIVNTPTHVPGVIDTRYIIDNLSYRARDLLLYGFDTGGMDADGDIRRYIPKEQYDEMVEWAESELCGALEGELKVGDMVMYTDSNNITSTGKITEVVALMSESLDTPSLRYVVDGELYSRTELSKCADDTMDDKDTSVEPYKRGDRVRIVDAYDGKYIGKVGVIQSVVSTNPNLYTIMFKPGKWTHDMLELIKED